MFLPAFKRMLREKKKLGMFSSFECQRQQAAVRVIKKKILAHAYTCKHTYSLSHTHKTKNMARKTARTSASWTRTKPAWMTWNFRIGKCRLPESWQMDSGQKTQTEHIPKDKLSPAVGSVWPWPGLPAPFVEVGPAKPSSELQSAPRGPGRTSAVHSGASASGGSAQGTSPGHARRQRTEYQRQEHPAEISFQTWVVPNPKVSRERKKKKKK